MKIIRCRRKIPDVVRESSLGPAAVPCPRLSVSVPPAQPVPVAVRPSVRAVGVSAAEEEPQPSAKDQLQTRSKRVLVEEVPEVVQVLAVGTGEACSCPLPSATAGNSSSGSTRRGCSAPRNYSRVFNLKEVTSFDQTDS